MGIRRLLALLVIAALVGVVALLACKRSSGRKTVRNPGPVATVVFPNCCTVNGDVPVNYILIDGQSDPAAVAINFSTDGGSLYRAATERPVAPSEGISGLATGPAPGIAHFFVWDTLADFGFQMAPSVILRIFPTDPIPGTPGISLEFSIDNRGLQVPEVVDVSDSVINTVSNEVQVRFSMPLNPLSIINQGNLATDTFAVFRDLNTTPGGNFAQESGTITLSDGDTVIHYAPPFPFNRYREIRIVLTSRITDSTGKRLATGSSYPSEPLSFLSEFSNQVFEIRFIPNIGPETNRYREDPSSDIWFIDFDSFGTFDGDLGNRGLRGSDPLTAGYCRDRVIAQILSSSSEHYLRDPVSGAGVSGAYRISFSAIRPSGTLGFSYNRICLGLDYGGLWGVAWYDPGNGFKEDDCSRSIPLGVFAGGIWGRNSLLSPPLGPTDLDYVDGSYVLGTNPSRDSRFLRVRDVIWDWGHGLSVITSHEIGHSVGLAHLDSSFDNIMQSWSSPDHISNPGARFATQSRNILRGNLGQVP